MLRFAFASLRHRRASAVAGYLALFCAAAMLSACGALLETGLRGAIEPQRYAGTPVVVSGDQQIHWTDEEHKHGKTKTKTKSKELAERVWLPASVGTRLAAIPDATVVRDRSFDAALIGADGGVLAGAAGQGHGWDASRLTPYRLIAGTVPRTSSQLVLDQQLALRAHVSVGARVRVQSTSSPTVYVVAGVAAPQSTVSDRSAIFFAEAEATRLARHDSAVTAYGVFGASADEVRTAVRGTGAQVSTGDERGVAEFPDAAAARVTLTSMSAAIGGTSLIVAVLVVVGTFSLSIQQRSRELALLRAVGATSRQVRRLIGREAVLLGLLAGIPGALLGVPLAEAVRTKFVSLGTIPDTLGLARSPLPLLAALVATIAAALAASRISARRVATIRPAEALARSTTQPDRLGFVRTVAGLVVTAVAVAVTLVLRVLHTEPASIPVTYLSIMLWMSAVALLGPALVRAGTALLRVVWHRAPVGGFLAAENTRRYSRRVASVITPLALLVGVTTTVLFVPTTVDAAAQAQTRDGLTADLVLVSHGPGVPEAAVDRVRQTPGVRTATPLVQSTVWLGRDKTPATGVTPTGLTSVLDPLVTDGSLLTFGPRTVALSENAAAGRSVGDVADLTLGDGTRTSLRIVAIYGRSLGFGDALLPFDLLSRHVDSPLASTVLVSGSVNPATLRARLTGVAGIAVTDRGGYRQRQQDRRDAGTGANLVVLAMIIVFGAIAAVNTLVMAALARSREFALIRLVGATRRQARSVLRWELALVLLIAVALGSAAAWLTLTGFSAGLVGSATPTVRPWTYAAILVGVATLGALATAAAGRVLLRRAAGQVSS